MPRYASISRKQPRNWLDDGEWIESQIDGHQSIDVFEQEEARSTGILDKNGVEIFEIRDRRRIGF